MKVIRKTFLTAAVLVFSIALCLLSSVLVLAACSEKVTLRFETYGGTYLESVEGKVGTAYTVPKEPQKEGYYFEGWYLSSDFSGSPQELPESMPDESRTYYAKYGRYPVLTLQPEGGTISKTTHLIKPGVNITSFLSDFKPQKEGLLFGGWYLGDDPLDPEKVMDENDLTLTARYKAEYSVNVYLQNADEPEKFELSELSKSGSDWEGNELRPDLTPPEHFLRDESKPYEESRTLCAGENVLEYYFVRKSVNLTYSVLSPSGEKREILLSTRYGATVTLPQSPIEEKDAAFFGWATDASAPATYLPDETMTMGSENMTLYGTWGRKYDNVRGNGYLVVENLEHNGKQQAVFREEGSISRGDFFGETKRFELSGLKGRLDGRGGCLLDDSGKYLCYMLRYNRAGEEFGKLTLSFDDNTAKYSLGESTLEGSYFYEYDESENAYTGKYVFQSGEEKFYFTLGQNNSFLREGAEKGEYLRFDGRDLLGFDELLLDGFGGARAKIAGESFSGGYRGSGLSEKEWIFECEGKTFRFLLCERSFSAGEAEVGDEVFLVYDEALSGTYEGGGTLVLDGYGLSGEYRSASGESAVGAFERKGDFVTLYAKNTLRFTLRGTKFSRTGEEAGSYEGKAGELYLDGAGYCKLTKSDGHISEGSYQKLSQGEIEFTPSTGETLRVRINESGYDLFDSALYGNFEGSYTARLFLDGYGSGVYTSIDSDTSFPITVGHFDGEFLQIFSERFEKPRYYRIDADRELYLLQGPAVGIYPLFEGGEEKGDYLVLYDKSSGKLVRGGIPVNGTYTFNASENEVVFTSDVNGERFRIIETDQKATCIRFTGNETYDGEGRLTLDGYGHAVYQRDGTIEGEYRLTDYGVELISADEVLRFTLSEKKIQGKIEYLRYFGEEGELWLEKNGERAVYRGENTLEGSYQGQNFLFDGELKFSFKVFEESFAFYRPETEKTYSVKGGGSLALDGCGNGDLSFGDVIAKGKAEVRGEIIIFRSESLKTLTGSRAFRIAGEELEPLGEEYGNYSNEEFFLDGLGNAVYRGVSGSYRKLENTEREFLFEGGEISFRFRIKYEDGVLIFEKFSDALYAQTGTYTTTLGTLIVSGYGVELLDESGNRTTWKVISASDKAFVAETPQGVRYLVVGSTVLGANENNKIK